MDILKALLQESKFWTALFLLLQAILFYFVPEFPKEIWAMIDALFAIVIGTLLGKQIVKERAARLNEDPLP